MEKKNINDHLANERTFLAWIRTSIAIMGFGFVVVKFSLFMKQVSILLFRGNEQKTAVHSGSLGIFLVAIGVIIVILAFLHFIQTKRQIETDYFVPSNRHIIALCLCIVVFGGLLIWYLIESTQVV